MFAEEWSETHQKDESRIETERSGTFVLDQLVLSDRVQLDCRNIPLELKLEHPRDKRGD